MTPQRKRTLLNISALATALLAASGWIARSSALALDDRYVHTTDYDLQRLRDSTTTYDEIRDVHAIVSGLDSSDRCRRGLREYCR